MTTTGHTSTEALAEAAGAAGAAPSIHNTQPWRWRINRGGLDLYAERSRQLPATDPDGRQLALSCGAALHHARVVLGAGGWQSHVSRLPDRANPDLLARVTVTLGERAEGFPEATRMSRAVRRRRTDRRPVSRTRVSSEALGDLVKAAEAEDVHLEILRTDQVHDLAVAVEHAASVNADNPAIRAELRRWTGGERREGLGIPDDAIPERPHGAAVSPRTFARTGTMPIGREYDAAASYAILYGEADGPAGWLRGGEALSAVWLAAVELGVGMLPISEAVEVAASRETLHRALSLRGWPYIAMRLGIPDRDYRGELRPTPRLPAEQTVEVT